MKLFVDAAGLIQPGEYTAICTGVVDIGTHDFNYGETRYLALGFTLPDGKVHWEQFALSAAINGRLMQTLRSWDVADLFGGGELELRDLLGTPAEITLGEVEQERRDGTKAAYVRIVEIGPYLGDELDATMLQLPMIFFDMDEPESASKVKDKLPKELRDRAAKSPEWRKAFGLRAVGIAGLRL
jgi:hypothetical protein